MTRLTGSSLDTKYNWCHSGVRALKDYDKTRGIRPTLNRAVQSKKISAVGGQSNCLCVHSDSVMNFSIRAATAVDSRVAQRRKILKRNSLQYPSLPCFKTVGSSIYACMQGLFVHRYIVAV